METGRRAETVKQLTKKSKWAAGLTVGAVALGAFAAPVAAAAAEPAIGPGGVGSALIEWRHVDGYEGSVCASVSTPGSPDISFGGDSVVSKQPFAYLRVPDRNPYQPSVSVGSASGTSVPGSVVVPTQVKSAEGSGTWKVGSDGFDLTMTKVGDGPGYRFEIGNVPTGKSVILYEDGYVLAVAPAKPDTTVELGEPGPTTVGKSRSICTAGEVL